MVELAGRQMIHLVVLLGHSGRQRERSSTQRSPALELVRPGPGDPGALHYLLGPRADVLILDVRLPELSGAELAAELRAVFPGLRVLVLEGYDHVGLLNALADLSGPEAPALAADVWAAATLAVNWRCLLPSELDIPAASHFPDPLTRREYEVLRLMASGRHNRDIARDLGISVKTVEFHISHVLSKLGVSSRVEAIIQARRLLSLNSRNAADGAA